jgi:hypothetical protein
VVVVVVAVVQPTAWTPSLLPAVTAFTSPPSRTSSFRRPDGSEIAPPRQPKENDSSCFSSPLPKLFLSNQPINEGSEKNDKGDVDNNEEELSMEAFQKAKEQAEAQQKKREQEAQLQEFDGYMLRDVIYNKWGACYDVDFHRVDSFGVRSLYLNVLPFQLGRRPFRHETELDYLCHLQAVVEILQKYNQLDYVLYQMEETTKRPRPGTSPLVAVPLRLDLTPEQVKQILNY